MSTIQAFSQTARRHAAFTAAPAPAAGAPSAAGYDALLDRLHLHQAAVQPSPAVNQAAVIQPSAGLKQLFEKLDTLVDRLGQVVKPKPVPEKKPAAQPKPEPKPAAQPKPPELPKPAPKAAAKPNVGGGTFVSQYRSASNTGEDASRANGNCGPASLTIVAEAFGKRSVTPGNANSAIEDTRRRMGAGTSNASEYNGTSYDQLVKGAKSYGLDSAVLYGGLEKLKAELAKGRLVIAHLRPSYLFPNSTSGHYTVVTKVENGRVYMHDPANPKGPMSITVAQFTKAQAQRGAYGLISLGA
ncbi:MAG TPA: C39 family peptidase [Pantanalinema sp.]